MTWGVPNGWTVCSGPKRSVRPHTVIGVMLAALTGCLEPQPLRQQPAVIQGGGRMVPLRFPRVRGPFIPLGARDLHIGRIAMSVAERHGLKPYRPAAQVRSAIFADGFDDKRSPADLDWLRVGNPRLSIISETQDSRFLRIRGGSDQAVTGLAKQLYAAPLAGRTVVCQVRTRRPSAQGTMQVDSWVSAPSPRNTPVVRFVILTEGGREEAVNWPLVWRPSPGWEVERGVWSVPPGVLGVRLEVILPNRSVEADFDDFLICDASTFSLTDHRVPELAPKDRPDSGNLLLGGDFEVGQECFGVIAVEPQVGAVESEYPRARIVPAPWYFDHPGHVRGTCLAVPLDSRASVAATEATSAPGATDRVRVWLGPVLLERPGNYVVSLSARATHAMGLDVSLWVGGSPAGRVRLQIDESWRRLAHAFPAMGLQVPGEAFVVIEADRRSGEASAGLWLDAVSLAPSEPPETYRAPNRVALGILGPAADPLDVGCLLDRGQPVEFRLRLINYDRRAFVGQICMDVLDAMDRVVWTNDAFCSLTPSGNAKDTFESSHQLRLGRGYYRILATAWLGAKGNARPVSQAVHAFAVLNLHDALPAGAPIGMPVAPGRYSARMTQWGVGWARVALEGPDAQSDPARWAALVSECRKQRLEIIGEYSSVGETAPPFLGNYSIIPAARLARLGNFRAEHDKHALSGKQDDKTGHVVARLEGRVQSEDQIRTLARRASLKPGDAIELALGAGLLPEDAEPELERLRHFLPAGLDLRVWERGLHVAPSSNSIPGLRVERAQCSENVMRRILLDPALEASEMVRGVAVRLWYGFDRIALGTYPFQATDPVGSTWPSDTSHADEKPARSAAAFSEYDHAPKPALAALDFLAEMLNQAVPVEWIDGWMQARALCFERGKDEGVALLWRPFGTTASLHRLRGLAPLLSKPGRGPESSLWVRNCFGQIEPCLEDGQDLIIPVSAFVLYLSAQRNAWQQLRDTLPAALGAPDEHRAPE